MLPVEWIPASPLELSRMVAENYRDARSPLMPVGGRTSLHYGGIVPSHCISIQTAQLNRVIDYPARDMTITVEAGLRVAELNEILKVQNQRLPIDVAQAHRATIGGAIAANTSGPGRYGYGTFRDYVLGISAIDGQGRLFSAGGRVVKNVAGYDLCKLMIGSLGTLGIITQITLKVRPLPDSRRFVLYSVAVPSQLERILDRLNTSATRPVVLDLLNPKALSQLRSECRLNVREDRFLLCIGFEGDLAETEWQCDQIRLELEADEGDIQTLQGEEPDRLWEALTEYQTASDDPLTFRACVPPSQVMQLVDPATQQGVAVQAHAGNGVVIGHLPDRCPGPEAAARLVGPLRTFVEQYRGSLVLLQGDDDWKRQVGSLGADLPGEPLMRSLKIAFDPASLLSPGRLWEQGEKLPPAVI